MTIFEIHNYDRRTGKLLGISLWTTTSIKAAKRAAQSDEYVVEVIQERTR